MNLGSRTFSIFDFGAVGDGITDDTVAFNAGIAALNTKGGKLLVPGSTYQVAGPLTPIALSASIIGDGMGVTTILAGSDDLFLVASDGPVSFSDLSITAPAVNTGSGITINAASSGQTCNSFSELNRVWLSGFARNLNAGAVSTMVVDKCIFTGTGVGVWIENKAQPDAGFGRITNCTFSGNGSNYGIFAVNNGGLHILGNFFMALAGAYRMLLDTYATTQAPSNTSDLIFTGNFCDQWGAAAISLEQANPGSGLTNIVIANNSFSALDTPGYPSGNVIQVLAGTLPYQPQWLGQLAIHGNVFQFAETANADAINLKSVLDCVIGVNNFYRAGPYLAHAAVIDSSCKNVVIAPGSIFSNFDPSAPNPIQNNGS